MSRRAVRALPLIVAALAFVAHASTLLGTAFLYDDLHSVRDNAAIRELARIPSFFWDPDAFSDLPAPMYRPVLVASLSLCHAAGSGARFPFALFDLLVHAACAALLLDVARRLGASVRGAFVAAALFAVHPLAAEAVHMISARSDQLLLLGALVALRAQIAVARGRGCPAMLVAAGGVAIACGAKETGVLLPGVLVAAEVGLGGAQFRPLRAVRRVGPALAIALGYLLARRALLGVATAAPALTGGTDPTTGWGRDLVTQLATMGASLPRLFAQALVPVGLAIDPPVHFERDPLALGSLLGWASLALLFAAGLRAGRRRPAVVVGLALCAAICLPWVVVPLNAPLGEHRFYGALAGLALAVSPWLGAVARRLPRPGRAALVAAVLALGGLSTAHGSVLTDPQRAWDAALAVNPESASALQSLAQLRVDAADAAARAGDAAAQRTELLRAAALLDRAIALRPNAPGARRAMVLLRCRLGPQERGAMQAVPHAEVARSLQPKSPFRRLEQSAAYTLAGQVTGDPRWFDAAVEAALSCLEIREAKGLVFRTAAAAREAQGDLDAAIALLDESVARGLDHFEVRYDRARLLLRAGRAADARRDLAAVLAAEPFHAGARALLHAAPPR
ncbi:MAG: hypothetical protein IPM29_11400 [Planctomycetes bacterium]|nr:hypothetical protein [Planctomycetota bacterium]